MSAKTEVTWTASQRPELGPDFWCITLSYNPRDSLYGYCGAANAYLASAAPNMLAALECIAETARTAIAIVIAKTKEGRP